MYDLNSYKFGQVLKTARKSKNISIEKLSELIGKTPSTIYKYERNEVVVDLPTVLEICNALDMDFNEFVDKKKIEETKELSNNPFETNLIYMYYLGFDDITIFSLEIKEENGYQKVYFKKRDDNTIYYVGTLEASHDIAYITMKNYYATNKRFEKVQIIINLKYSSDNKYMATISGTTDDTNLPIIKKCILSKSLITSRKDINEAYERLKFTDKEFKEFEEKHNLIIHFDNKNDYEIMGIKNKNNK